MIHVTPRLIRWLTVLTACFVLMLVATIFGLKAEDRLIQPDYHLAEPITVADINEAAAVGISRTANQPPTYQDTQPIIVRPRIKQDDLASFMRRSITRQGGATTIQNRGFQLVITAVMTPENARSIRTMATGDANSQTAWVENAALHTPPEIPPGASELIYKTVIVTPTVIPIAGVEVSLPGLKIISFITAIASGSAAIMIAIGLLSVSVSDHYRRTPVIC